MSKTKYSALCCYFGRWPSYFEFWLSSCKYNKEITFFMISDISLDEYNVPDNVIVIKMSFAEVQVRIHEFLDKEIEQYNGKTACIDVPYKLCEFKAAYGYIFKDFFESYDYWGFYDIDTIWGNIMKFIPKNPNNQIAKIFRCGHLCFVKNDNVYSQIFRYVNDIIPCFANGKYNGCKIKPWQVAFSEPTTNYYDEFGGLEPLLKYLGENNNVIYYHQDDFDNVFPPYTYNHFHLINSPESKNVVYSFDKGVLCRHYFNQGKHRITERAYLHISKRKITVQTHNKDQFIIYPNKIVDNKDLTVIDLLLYGRTRYIRKTIQRGWCRIQKLLKFDINRHG